MARGTKATDWEYAGVLSLSASIGLGGGGWLFSFRSKQAQCWEDFVLLGMGIAVPGLSIEVSVPDMATDDLSWSKIQCLRPFSAADLHDSFGDFRTVGASALLVGYSKLYLTAKSKHGPAFFMDQVNDGFSVGVELKPVANISGAGGTLYSIGTVLRDYIVPVINVSFASVGFATGLVQAGDALLTGRGQAVSYSFCNGYARRLADVTSEGKWEIGEDRFQQLQAFHWASVVRTLGKLYRDGGSKANPSLLDNVEIAGEAAILQDVQKLYDTKGEDYCKEIFKRQRTLYGANKDFRRKKYLDVLYKQVQASSNIGIRLDA